MPFAGSAAEGATALAALRALSTEPGDELILADNAGVLGDGGTVIGGACRRGALAVACPQRRR